MSLRLFDVASARGFRHVAIGEIPARASNAVVWIDATSPTAEDIDRLGELYGFHDLAIEDARKRQQRPKLDAYDDHLFVVLYALDPPDDRVAPTRELAMFVTDTTIVTIHRQVVEELDVAASRWRSHCARELPETAAMLAYTICDSIVDGYFVCLDEVGERIESIERAMFVRNDEATLESVFKMKRQLLEMRRVTAPTRDVFNLFVRRELPVMGDQSLVYFQDIYDHVIRVTDSIDAYRDILSSVIDIHMTLVSNRLNQTVRTLTVASIILMSLALIAGVYGMNFTHMPELDWRFGYPAVIIAMATLGGGLAFIFRRLGWW